MHRSTIIAAVFLAALACGCRGPDISPSPGLGDPYPAPLNDPQISVLSPDLRPWIRFSPAYIVDDGHRPMHVEVPVRNLTVNQYLVEFRFLFYDAFGTELTPTMGWEMIPLDPKQTVRMRGRALSTEAVSYRLEVRWAR